MYHAGSIANASLVAFKSISTANSDLNFLDSWLSHAERENIRWENAGK